MDDMFRGGIANVSRHTVLPPMLLGDLAFRRGEETDFFAPGGYAGTPYRTLPARKKPLIQLGEDYYAIDPCFARDAGYRPLLFNLLNRRPDYARTFKDRQKTMSEAAFADILSGQLPNAALFQEVYYKDPATKQWAENDTLIVTDVRLLPLLRHAFRPPPVKSIDETAKFLKSLARSALGKIWEATREKLLENATLPGLNLKPWRKDGEHCYGVRLNDNFRAHLKHLGNGNWEAYGCGSHRDMGHG
jgi:hypothetical protein